ncbi:hypothetical protein QQS21_007478 [Conoideocrella luteorostrata]|uniref:Galactose oxidase n=1 Tax=Conoideocrella luteorostrata TaxID=1105319 RepID=A0AAJ0FS06_9HYPO|nr:hypothetical protein QQS21_007478 [Conoideocrella luteorostrata]
MSDAAKSGRPPNKAVKTKSIRSTKSIDKSVASASSGHTALYRGSDDSEDEPTVPLPRSHTPGHLASKSINDRRRKPSDLSIRQRSQSTSQIASNPGPRSYVATLPPISNDAETPAENEDKEKKRPAASRTNSSIGGRTAVSTSATARPAVKITKPPKGQHVPFPPLPDAKDAPNVELAPASGMYWSKAFVSGSPHSNLRAHTTTLIGSNIYIFGGCDARTCFNSVYVFDADAFYWSVPYMVGDIPFPLRAMTCTAVGKKLVVFGGGDGPAYYNDVYVLDTVNFRWTKPRIHGDRIPSKRRAHTACLYKNGIYVFGGGDGVRALNEIWRLDVSDVTKMSWKLISGPEKAGSSGKETRPKARGYHTANMVGSKLIIFGGSDGGECFDDVWVYDIETHIWKSVDIPITYRRLSHTSTIVGSYLFVIGGHDGSDYCNDVLLLNLVTMTWDKRKVYGQPPSARGYHGTVLYDSRLMVIGGFDGGEVFGDVSILELAVHAYYSQISHFTIEV